MFWPLFKLWREFWRRLLVMGLSLPLSALLGVWVTHILQLIAPQKVPIEHFWLTASMLASGFVYALALSCLGLDVPKRRGFRWWLAVLFWSVLAIAISTGIVFWSSSSAQELMHSKVFNSWDIFLLYLKVYQHAIYLALMAGILPFGVAVHRVILENILAYLSRPTLLDDFHMPSLKLHDTFKK